MLEPINSEETEPLFTVEAIQGQVKKIVHDPIFENANILKDFLQYIVDEYLQGNSNQLKEYTIAINVLNKPTDFNTQENGIVRIHAARLTRFLDVYYKEHGLVDYIRISIPKGTYIPRFSRNFNNDFDPSIPNISRNKSIVIGLVPFNHSSCNESEILLLKGIELQLMTALMKINHFSVISFQIISAVVKEGQEIKKIINDYGLDYLITGEANAINAHLRLYVFLLKTSSNQQVWAKMYKKEIINNNHFEIQDEIVAQILEQLIGFSPDWRLS